MLYTFRRACDLWLETGSCFLQTCECVNVRVFVWLGKWVTVSHSDCHTYYRSCETAYCVSCQQRAKIHFAIHYDSRCQWLRGLRRVSAAARLMVSQVRIPPGHGGLSCVNVVYCQIKICVSGWSLIQRHPIECGVSECNRKASIMSSPWPNCGCCAMGK
jgi:hypothetical protein